MFTTMPYKKMEKINKFGFIAKCDCGHSHRFKSNDINLSKSNGATTIFKNVYKCPNCGQIYDGIFEYISDRNVWYRQLNLIGTLIMIILAVGLVFGGYKFYTNVLYSPPTDYEHMTNKQLNDFLQWDHEQQQNKWENQPAFNNK